MLKNYIKIAWRNLRSSKAISAINILGLAVGIAFVLLIAGYAWSQWQVNRSLRHADQQYILQSRWKNPNMGFGLTTLGPLARELKTQYPNLVANYYRWDGITSNISTGDKHFREGLQVCDSTLLSMYGFGLLHGDQRTALSQPFSILVSENKARKFFGRTDVVGEILQIENFSGGSQAFQITGVLKQPAPNSVTALNDRNVNELFIPLNTLSFFGRTIEAWNNQYTVGYIELKPGVVPADLEKPLASLIAGNAPAAVAANMQAVPVPLSRFYLDANNGVVRKLAITLLFVAAFILLMAVINFVNISISRSATRMREIGLRKALGGLRKQLMFQFLTESIILVFIATLLSLVIYELVRPLFASMLGREVLSLFAFPWFFLAIPALLTLFVGLLAGFYPAMVLSSLKAVDTLKGRVKTGGERVGLRKTLVGIQFAIAAVVLVGSLLVNRQVTLFFGKDLGYNKDQVLAAQVPRNWNAEGLNRMNHVRDEFRKLPQVKNASISYEIPDGNNMADFPVYRQGWDSAQAITMQGIVTDEYYAALYQIPVVAGEFFGRQSTNSVADQVVLNEIAAKALGWSNPDNAIGQPITVNLFGNKATLTVRGITRDFHYGSMQQTIQPLVFLQTGLMNTYRYLSFKLNPGSVGTQLAELQKAWSTILPGVPFEYRFMDETLARIYSTEIQLRRAAFTATALTVLILLLGVLGLVTLSIHRRIKEIGIRKVLGATVPGILLLFLKEFLGIALLASLVACPLGYWLMDQWLEGYATRIAITAGPFLMAVLALSLVTFLLIAIRTYRVAQTSPAKMVRNE